MQTRRLPNTDLDLSVIGMGCWAMGNLWWGDDVTDARSIAAVEKALEVGINWFDTAPLYGHGHADDVLIKALGKRKHDVIIASKVGVRWDGEGQHARSELSRDWIRQDVDASLRRLGVERIDLLQVHWPCELDTPLEESMGELAALQKAGKIRHVGLCNYDVAGLTEARKYVDIASLQTPYSMLRRELEQELLPYCRRENLGVLAYEPLCRGLLTGKFAANKRFPESDLRARDDRFQGSRFLRALTIVSRLELIAKRKKVPIAALALGWAIRQPGMTAVIAGAKGPEQIAEHVRTVEILDDEALWGEVDRVVAAYRG
jgi:aryl-alcohol dehydrogenase-like predicted oxidoreductase